MKKHSDTNLQTQYHSLNFGDNTYERSCKLLGGWKRHFSWWVAIHWRGVWNFNICSSICAVWMITRKHNEKTLWRRWYSRGTLGESFPVINHMYVIWYFIPNGSPGLPTICYQDMGAHDSRDKSYIVGLPFY